MNANVNDIETAISEVKYHMNGKSEISPKSYKIIIEALGIQVPEHPRYNHSYEYADIDGNRGIWVDFIHCPNCGYDLCDEEEPERCPECEQLLDWGLPEEDYWEY